MNTAFENVHGAMVSEEGHVCGNVYNLYTWLLGGMKPTETPYWKPLDGVSKWKRMDGLDSLMEHVRGEWVKAVSNQTATLLGVINRLVRDHVFDEYEGMIAVYFPADEDDFFDRSVTCVVDGEKVDFYDGDGIGDLAAPVTLDMLLTHVMKMFVNAVLKGTDVETLLNSDYDKILDVSVEYDVLSFSDGRVAVKPGLDGNEILGLGKFKERVLNIKYFKDRHGHFCYHTGFYRDFNVKEDRPVIVDGTFESLQNNLAMVLKIFAVNAVVRGSYVVRGSGLIESEFTNVFAKRDETKGIATSSTPYVIKGIDLLRSRKELNEQLQLPSFLLLDLNKELNPVESKP